MNSKPKSVHVDFILLLRGRVSTVYHLVTINDRLNLQWVQLTQTMDDKKQSAFMNIKTQKRWPN